MSNFKIKTLATPRFSIDSVDNGHASGLLDRMKQKKRNFNIIVGERSFPVHKNIIMNASNFFDEMLDGETKEAKQGFIKLENVKPDAVEQCIDFIYNGHADVDFLNIRNVLHAAELMQLSELREECIGFMHDNLTPETCLEVINMGKLYNEENLQSHAERYLLLHLPQVILTEDYCQVEKMDLVKYLTHFIGDCEQKWKAVTTWLDGKQYSNDMDIVELMEAVRVSDFPFRLLFETLWREFRVQCNEISKRLVLDGMFSDLQKFESNVTVENFFALRDVARKKMIKHRETVLNIFTKFLNENFEALSQNQRFVDEFTTVEIKEFFVSREAHITEKTKLRFALHWAKQCRNRERDFEDLFAAIDFERIPQDLLKPLVETEALITHSTKCRDKIFYALLRAKDSVEVMLDTLFDEPSVFTLDTDTGVINGYTLETGLKYSLPRTRSNGCSGIITVGRRLYLRYFDSIYILENSGIWKKITDASNGKGKPLAFQGKLYLFTDLSWQCFDPDSDSWSTGDCDVETPCDNLNLVSTRNFIYGFEFDCPLVNIYGTCRFFPDGLKTQIEKVQEYSLNFAEKAYLIAHKDYIYSLHGLTETSRRGRKEIHRFNCKSNQFDKLNIPANTVVRSHFGICIVGTKFYIVGGDQDALNPAAQDSIEVYDQDKESWEILRYIDPSNKLFVCGYTPSFRA